MMLKISGWGNVELKILEFVYIRDSTIRLQIHVSTALVIITQRFYDGQ